MRLEIFLQRDFFVVAAIFLPLPHPYPWKRVRIS